MKISRLRYDDSYRCVCFRIEEDEEMERNLNERLKEESINREREDKSCSIQ